MILFVFSMHWYVNQLLRDFHLFSLYHSVTVLPTLSIMSEKATNMGR